MLKFPLVYNELLRQARRADTYWSRLGVIVLALCPIFVMWIFARVYGATEMEEASYVSVTMLMYVLMMQFIVAFLAAPIMASNAITQEKEDATLGLLMMADLRGWDIVLAKYTSVELRIATLMLCASPFYAFAAIFGGVDIPAMLMCAAILFVCASAMAACGVFYSTIVRHSSMAGSLTLLTAAVCTATITALNRLVFPVSLDPTAGIRRSLVSSWQLGADKVLSESAPGLVLVSALGLAFLCAAVAALPAQVFQEVKRPAHLDAKLRRSSTTYWRQDPVARLVASCVGGISLAGRHIVLRILGFMGICIILLLPIAGWMFVMVVLFREILLSMERLRNDGTLDDFVLTPHLDTQLGIAFWWGHVRAARIYLLLLLLSLPIYIWLYRTGATFVYTYASILVAQFFAVIAMACFCGTFRTRAGSVGAYLFLLFVLLGYVLPAGISMWWQRRTYDLDSWIDLYVDGKYELVWTRLGGADMLASFIATNVTGFLLLTALCCVLIGRRLRSRPILEFALRPSEPRQQAEAPA